MKRFVTLLIFSFLFSSLYSQVQNSKYCKKYNLGIFFLGTGDILIPKFEFELRHKTFKNLSFGLSANIGHVNSEAIIKLDEGYAYYTTSMHFDQFAYLNVLTTSYFNFNLGFGSSFLYVHHIRGWKQVIDEANAHFESDYRSETSYTFGGQIAPELIFGNINAQNRFYLKGIIQPYFNGEISSGLAVGLIKSIN